MYQQNRRNNPDFNRGGSYMGNPDFNSGGNYMANPGGGMDLNFGGDDSRRTVTVKSKMDYDRKPMFDRGYNNDFQPNFNLSEGQNRDYNPVGMNYEQNRDQYNDRNRDQYNDRNRDQYNDQRPLGFEPNQDVKINRSSNYRSERNRRVYSIIQKMQMYVSDKPIRNAAQLFINASNTAGASFDLNYIPPDSNTGQHRFNVIVENMLLAFGTSLPSNESSTSAKNLAQHAAYMNALNRLRNSSADEICSVSAGKPDAQVNRFAIDVIIEPDPIRPISALVIRESEKNSKHRVKKAMHILRSSAYFSKLSVDTVKSEVGSLHKVTVLVQNQPVGIGLGSSITAATTNAAADALFNNFYRKCPIIYIEKEDYSQQWINWSNVKYLANEMESIGGRSLGFGQGISNRSFAFALKKLVDSHSWNEVDNELVFGPGMSEDCATSLSNIARERNLKLEVRKHPRLGDFYILQRHYDSLDLVDYLKRNGGRKGKFRLVNKSEIPQIRCDYWEPSSSVWNKDTGPKSKGLNLNKQKVSQFSNRETNQRNVGASSIQSERNTFGNKRRMAVADRQAFDYNTNEYDALPHSKDKYSMLDNDGRYNPKFAQDNEMGGFNDREFQQVSRANSDFRPMSDSFERESKKMSWADEREFGQMRRSDDPEFGQMSRPDDREFRMVSRTNIDEPKQTTWRDRMPGSFDRETSRSDIREFEAMESLERELQRRSQMDRGMSDNFDKNPRLGHDERRREYSGPNFNRMSNEQDRELNSQFRTNDGNRQQMQRSYDDNYKNIAFDKPTSGADNRNYNQLMGRNKRDYDNVSVVDSNRPHSQAPNFDDRRLRFNDEPQNMDRRSNQMDSNNMMNANTMQNNGPRNNMQNSRNDDRRMANNPGMFPPNQPVPPQRNMLMQQQQQNMMAVNQDLNKNPLTVLRFLTKKIAHNVLHANVKHIIANARRLSNIASARSRMEKSGPQMPPFQVRNRRKPTPFPLMQVALKKKPNVKPSNLKKSSNQKVSTPNKK